MSNAANQNGSGLEQQLAGLDLQGSRQPSGGRYVAPHLRNKSGSNAPSGGDHHFSSNSRPYSDRDRGRDRDRERERDRDRDRGRGGSAYRDTRPRDVDFGNFGNFGGATDVVPIKKMEEIIDMAILTVTESEIAKLILEMIVGRINLETIAGKTAETITEWVVDGRTIEREVEQTLKSTGQFPLPEMSDWRWSYLVLAILALTLVNMRISQLRLPGITYLHTSHLLTKLS